MRTYLIMCCLFVCSWSFADYAIVIHGGAGTITRKNITPEKEKEIKSALEEAVKLGAQLLSDGKTAIEVVEKVVMLMEDSPLFNAGKGAVFNHEGKQEMDACIMDGKDLSVGAVAGVAHLKNPIVGARLVKDSTRHVMLSGKRAEGFCISKGAEYADSSYFFVKSRWDYLQKVLEREKNQSGQNDGGAAYMDEGTLKYGTVGCVVVDKYGNLAAATSTGGLTNKKYGRIGDSPIVGAGTYASNKSCAISCTGTGEFFIRGTIARDIAALMEYKNLSLEEAGKETLQKLTEMKGDGGFIGVDGKGNVIMMFNTEGMYRGYTTHEMEKPVVKVYGD
ncbi:MAG: isoaspartyl peptidase/L-asparaginase [Crocinitomicaceae bacterium]|nr:isoaspartyl peptidase/L-asparaginase [Crocinitomicaceae bacterium]